MKWTWTALVIWLALPACLAVEPTLVYLVRHAEKQDHTPASPLSEAGQRRVEVLRKFFKNISIDQVYSSQYRRTRDTVSPIAADHGLEVEAVAAHDFELLKQKIKETGGSTILIAGHSNTVPEIIRHLGGPALAIEDHEYSNLFLLILHEDRLKFQHFQIDP